MPYAENPDDRSSVALLRLAEELRVPCVQHAIGKCSECGATLCSPVDVQTHRCDRFVQPYLMWWRMIEDRLPTVLTRCRHGHLMTESNIYTNNRGHRECRECVISRTRLRASRRRMP